MNEWERLFGSHILERGWDYYQSGYVGKIKIAERGFSAMVDGSYSREYNVGIRVEDGQVRNMSCDCPYAEDGSHCKHMAAVLYKISENGFEKYVQTHKENQEKERQELAEIICKIPQDELKELVLQIAMKDDSFKRDIVLKYADRISVEHMGELERQIDDIAAEYSERYGYIEWDEIYDYICELEDFIYGTVNQLLENQHCLEAFELINKVFSSVEEQDMNDENGEVIQLADTCYELWKDILEECNEEQQRRIYETMKNARNDNGISELATEYMNDFLMYEFGDDSVLKEKLEALDQDIERALNNQKDQWNLKYYLENSLVQRVHIMEELDFSEKEIKEYRRKYWQFPAMRKMEINVCLEEGKIQEAIEILKESKELDKDSLGITAEYSKRLIELYHKSARKEEYKQELISYIFEYTQNNLEYIYKLKQEISEMDWQTYQEKILKEKSCNGIRYEFMEKEEMYEKLLEEVLKESYIGTLDRYENVLKKKFPIQIRDRYICYVKQCAEQASSRNLYRNLIVYLRKIKDYPEGTEITNKILNEWREKYKRRRAMMEELKMAGF